MTRPVISRDVLIGIQSQKSVKGLTHGFYKYPARFSPQLVRAVIDSFTQPGELVLDPFVGGGTTLVEASAAGRRAVGVDISPLAVFISGVKTELLSRGDRRRIHDWAISLQDLNLRDGVEVETQDWKELGYQKHLCKRSTWPIRKNIELFLSRINQLDSQKLQEFSRCVILRTAQWALDGRMHIPSVSDFRRKFYQFLYDMLGGAEDYEFIVRRSADLHGFEWTKPLCLHRSTIGLEQDENLKQLPPPALILTSPPYPGIHALYHRWQIEGGKETAAPFWIANVYDGQGESYYTFGSRKIHIHGLYYKRLRKCFSSLHKICDQDTIVVQVVGFSNRRHHLKMYLSALDEVGFKEEYPSSTTGENLGRIWRRVPNRRWYASKRIELSSECEVVLFHRKK